MKISDSLELVQTIKLRSRLFEPHIAQNGTVCANSNEPTLGCKSQPAFMETLYMGSSNNNEAYLKQRNQNQSHVVNAT